MAVLPKRDLQVLVGDLGFGFTVQTALADLRVRHVTVIERLAVVIDWHRLEILPWSGKFYSDPRLNVVTGDFLASMARDAAPCYDAILIDIDDSPSLLWHKSHAGFYSGRTVHCW